MIEALFWLFIKHFICDFPLQVFPWMYRNKGDYLHTGGLAHAALHGLGTLLILLFWLDFTAAFLYSLLDSALHYHIDWAKINTNRRFNLQPNNSEWFWVSLGFDQLLHHLTYFLIIFLAFNYGKS